MHGYKDCPNLLLPQQRGQQGLAFADLEPTFPDHLFVSLTSGVFGPSLALAEYAGTLNRVIWKTAMMASGTVTVSVTLQRNESIVVSKDVPAQVREDCGDYHLDGAATKRISALTEEAVERHAEVEVLWYAA